MNRITAVALAVLVATAALPAAAVGAGASAASPSQQSDGSAYAGTHVEFDTSSNAVTDYRVDGETVFENVTVASQSDHDSRTSLDASVGLDAVANLSGIGLDIAAQSSTRAEIATEGSASMAAHDSERGILTVDAGDEAQYVEAELGADATAEAESDDRVVVDSGERTGAFVVVGDGEVAVNENDDVTADLQSDSKLVFRSYADGERDENAKAQERMIANGTATAEVYAEERDGERVADVATYGQDIAVETSNESQDRLEMTVERSQSEGTVVITSVSEAAIDGVESAEDLSVTVDGEAAAQASSRSDLEGAIGSDQSRYMVTQSSDASASADVLVAVNHFSERQLSIQDSDDGGDSTDDGGDSTNESTDGSDSSGDSIPGFGAGAALIALLSGVAARIRQ
ncbi:PGF-CTERM sorting domain-containing protein [Natrinema salinisoli]|uniref:PGF-CTERM sorting domain-containing protein n=1 Tax=Natrinema salinisoli TaxID=2878535 RepID=UPI001CF06E5C|nr:PGF-CTERM sorting domain-containing protein [Natrinema salinisoli]